MNITPILAFGGPQDMIIIFAVVLIMFGAKKLPELAKGMGQAIREFNKAKDDIHNEITKPATELTVQPPKDTQAHDADGHLIETPAATPPQQHS